MSEEVRLKCGEAITALELFELTHGTNPRTMSGEIIEQYNTLLSAAAIAKDAWKTEQNKTQTTFTA